MPIITFESGKISEEKKRELLQKLVEVGVEVTGTPKEYFVVKIHEYPDDNFAMAGQTVTQIKEKLQKK